MQVQIENSWKEALDKEFSKPYFKDIKLFILNEKNNGKVTLPAGNLIFNAFNLTPLNKVKVVILGQDPYHGIGQAHGLSFSVPLGVKIPPSLKNIFKELKADLDFKVPNSGNLTNWSAQGVLLLNAILTVNEKEPASHRKAGWEYFTNAVIKALSDHKENLVFMLWGNFAKNKKVLIDDSKHLILEAAHPSPFSAYNGFFGCKHFSKANSYLTENNLKPIKWQL